MTSEIDPSNINPNFPTADQNNNSQGFRDNFSAIQTALGIATSEISSLQSTLIGATGVVMTASPVQITGPVTTLVTQFTNSNANYVLTFPGTSAVQIPAGNTAQRPSINLGPAGYGQIRFNRDTNSLEIYGIGGWQNINQGPTGAQGLTGPTGPLGGPTGPQGIRGIQGPVGPMGMPGIPGPTGSTGATGVTGPTGYIGPTGIPGTATNTGATGNAGAVGPTGSTGPTGIPGSASNTGATGNTGALGPRGTQGLSGLSGYSGVSGLSGYSGVSGYRGFSGFSGYSGLSGYSSYSGYSWRLRSVGRPVKDREAGNKRVDNRHTYRRAIRPIDSLYSPMPEPPPFCSWPGLNWTISLNSFT